MEYIVIEEAGSTNTVLAQRVQEMEEKAEMTMLRAVRQTQGRGQRGNSWESEPGKNLTASVFVHHNGFRASRQFSISEATALAVADTLEDFGVTAMVKWPNDIYVGDKKICGILIEHSVMGMNLSHSILGIGINLNQMEFVSDAPNPVSVRQLTGRAVDIERFSRTLGDRLETRLPGLTIESKRVKLHEEFLQRLWRGDGRMHPFSRRSDGQRFQARIVDIEPSGHLLLEDSEGNLTSHAFKEVEFLLK